MPTTATGMPYQGNADFRGYLAAVAPEYLPFVVNGSSPLSVNFTDKSPGTFTAWSWDFGDGGTSTAQNPTHTYTSSGIYNVSLSATDYVGTGSYTINNLINVGPGITGISTISNLQELTF